MPTATLSRKGWIVIPQEIRKQYGLTKGDKVHITAHEGHITIIPVAKNPIAAGRGMLKGGPSLTRALLEERRRELDREEQGLGLPPR